jgi:hypothetical protein
MRSQVVTVGSTTVTIARLSASGFSLPPTRPRRVTVSPALADFCRAMTSCAPSGDLSRIKFAGSASAGPDSVAAAPDDSEDCAGCASFVSSHATKTIATAANIATTNVERMRRFIADSFAYRLIIVTRP